MSEASSSTDRFEGHRLVVAVVLVTLVLTGPVVGFDVTKESPELGDGNATVEVLDAPSATIPVTHGRFGTDVSYVRIPEAAVDVRNLTGSPRIAYEVTVPELGVDRRVSRIVTDEGRVRLELSDRALAPDTDPGTYTGRVDLRLQSFEGQTVLVNRTVEVTVP